MTLVELLVAMSMSVVVIFAASAIIVSSLNVTKQVGARVDALEEGRTGLETLMQQLNSACLASDTSPVLAATTSGIAPVTSSDASDLVFVSGAGDSTNATPTEHVVTLKSGALVDTAYLGNQGSNPPTSWTFATTPASVQTLMTNVTAGSAAMFRYYSYSNPTNPNTNSLLNAAPLTPMPLTSATAPTVAEIDVDLRVGPAAGTFNATAAQAQSETSEFSDSATFRLTAADPNDPNYPCD